VLIIQTTSTIRGAGSIVASRSHLFALLGAISTGFGATPAVLGFVLLAFASTCLADSSTEGACFRSKATRAGHQLRGQPTNASAVTVEQDAVPHHVDVCLTEAALGAVVAAVAHASHALMQEVKFS
jgi:hypothetical protein